MTVAATPDTIQVKVVAPSRWAGITPAMLRIYAEVARSGRRVYGGRHRGPIEGLERMELVEVDHDWDRGVDGHPKPRFTVWPANDRRIGRTGL